MEERNEFACIILWKLSQNEVKLVTFPLNVGKLSFGNFAFKRSDHLEKKTSK